MASYHCTVKAGASFSAAAHADYIEREGRYKKKKDSDLEEVESGNLPAWAKTSADFWQASDENERANAKGYREFEVALPREFTRAQRLALVQDFVRQELGERHAYTFAIHNPKASLDGGEQPHAHIMFSERHRDGIERPPEQYFKRYNAKNPEKGGCRKGDGSKTPTERKAELVALRARWADLQNKHLEMHGAAARVDHRSLKDQEVQREPERHLGPRQIQTNSLAAQRVQEARADRTLSALLAGAVAGAQRRLDRLENLARAVVAKFTTGSAPSRENGRQADVSGPVDVTAQVLRSPPVAARPAEPDPVDFVAQYMVSMQAEIQRVKKAGAELEARSVSEAKTHQAKKDAIAIAVRSMVEPGMLSRSSVKDKFARDLAEAKAGGQAAYEAEAAAIAKASEARKMQADAEAVRIAAANLRREQPERVKRVGELLKARPELQQLAAQRLAELARPAPKRGIEPAPTKRPDIDKMPGR